MAQLVKVKVAVIGAGVAGLVAARELQREGHNVVIFEKNYSIGGQWVHDPKFEPGPFSKYPAPKPVLQGGIMGFLRHPFGDRDSRDPRAPPSHEEALRFTEEFAADFGIRGLIQLKTEVVKVERKGKGQKWEVELRTSRRGGDSVSRWEVFDAVVVCSSQFLESRYGEVPGIENWRGTQIHSHNYIGPQPFKDQVVIIIGLGPNSYDIWRDIAPLAKEVHVATKDLMGMKLENRGNIRFHDMIKCVYENGLVEFEDGFSFKADSIIHCTGYKYNLPLLETNEIKYHLPFLKDKDNHVGPLYKNVFPPALAPCLSFVGLTFKDSVFKVTESQSKWVARVLSGKVLLPTEKKMMESTQDFYQFMEESGLPKNYTQSKPGPSQPMKKPPSTPLLKKHIPKPTPSPQLKKKPISEPLSSLKKTKPTPLFKTTISKPTTSSILKKKPIPKTYPSPKKTTPPPLPTKPISKPTPSIGQKSKATLSPLLKKKPIPKLSPLKKHVQTPMSKKPILKSTPSPLLKKKPIPKV